MTHAVPGPPGRLRAAVDRGLGGFLAGLMGLLVLDVLWQVLTRFVMGDPSSFTDELARYLLIWVGLLGAAWAVGRRMHLAIDILPRHVTGWRRTVLEVGIEVLVLLFASTVLVVGGVRLMGLTLLLGQTSAALGVPLGYVYSVLPLSGCLITFYSLSEIASILRGARDPGSRGASRDREAGPDERGGAR